MTRLQQFLAVNRAIAGSLDHDELLRLVVENTRDFAGAEACALLLSNGDGATHTASAVGAAMNPIIPLSFVLDESIHQRLRDAIGSPEDGRLISVPVIQQGSLIGILAILQSHPDVERDEGEAFWLSALADQAAIALKNADRLGRARESAAEAAAAEHRFRAFIESAPDAIVVVDSRGIIQLVNVQTERLFGYRRQQLLGQPMEILIPHRYRGAHVRHVEHYFSRPELRPMGSGLELWALRSDGAEFPVEISLGPLQLKEGFMVSSAIRDVSERRQAELERRRLLESERQKSEQLSLAIREAHHRIKNNLQAISDFLTLELVSTDSPAATQVLRESVDRVKTIALVHDLLSRDEDVRWVDASRIAEKLVPALLTGLCGPGCAPELNLEVQSVALSSKRATTLALILNELVSNAGKHAFAQRTRGRLGIRLGLFGDLVRLEVEDDGPGLPPGFDPGRDANVGLQVVQALAVRDLRGKLVFSHPPGLTVTIEFDAE